MQVINDSELVAKQVNGRLQGQAPGDAAAARRALSGARPVRQWSISSVPRAQNAGADALVNRALDGKHSRQPVAATWPPPSPWDNLRAVTDALEELRSRLQEAATALRAGTASRSRRLALIEECARLATEVAAQVDGQVRAALEPLPDLPGQLPLPAASAS